MQRATKLIGVGALLVLCGCSPQDRGRPGERPTGEHAFGGLEAGPPPSDAPPVEDASVRPPRIYYTFVDASGSIRMVDGLDAVPADRIDQARRIVVEDAPAGTGDARPRHTLAAARRSEGDEAEAARPASRGRDADVEVVVYTAKWCGWCRRTLEHLDERGVAYRNRDVEEEPAAARDLRRLTGSVSIPVVDIDGEIVRGYDVSRMDRLLDARR